MAKLLIAGTRNQTNNNIKSVSFAKKLRGILPINKPTGLSSYDCIRKIKPMVRGAKIGHAGTLDPIAQGLLLILFNSATKIAQYLSVKDKEYIAKIRLGTTTDTDDITGQIIQDNDYSQISQDKVFEALNSFIGEKYQTPPKFSALKHRGKKVYQLARRGIDFTPAPRKIIIKSIELLKLDLPIIEIKTTVSKGTYIRALARDIGEFLGCGACLQDLIRTRIGRFIIENAVDLEEINSESLAENLYSINEALCDMPSLVMSQVEIEKLVKGQSLLINPSEYNVLESPLSTLRVVDNRNRVLIISKYQENRLYPERLVYADL